MKILFSPIGGTDPISNYHDGAMLHICRKYLPDKVYLYLSGEMCREHDRNDPYGYCIRQLEQETGHPIAYEILRKDDLTEVQVFDSFVNEFREILKKIRETEGEERILVNVSSGTPAMKSSLLMLSVLSEGSYIPIQVATPERKMNPKVEDRKDFDPEEQWEVNEDNVPEYVDRTSIASSQNWAAEIKKEVIQRHIEAYNYVAALQVADHMQDFDPTSRALIHAAVCRLRLDFKNMDKIVNQPEYSSAFIPVRKSYQRILVEYSLSLDIRLRKQEYADFLRALSPILMDIYKLVLKEDCGIDIDRQYTAPKKGGGLRWSSGKLLDAPEILGVLETEYGANQFDSNGRVENAHLALLVSKLSQSSFSKDRVALLRKVERELRNVAAHQMVSVTRETVKETVDVWPEQILKSLKEVLDRYIIGKRENVWNSYDLMNAVLLKSMK